MIFVHCEVVSCKNIAIVPSIDTPQINAIVYVVRMSDYLLIVGCVSGLEFHVCFHLTEKEPACIWSLCVSRRWDLSVKYAFQKWDFRPGQVVVDINMHVFPSPVFRSL